MHVYRLVIIAIVTALDNNSLKKDLFMSENLLETRVFYVAYVEIVCYSGLKGNKKQPRKKCKMEATE
jgi:hypothetical protein